MGKWLQSVPLAQPNPLAPFSASSSPMTPSLPTQALRTWLRAPGRHLPALDSGLERIPQPPSSQHPSSALGHSDPSPVCWTAGHVCQLMTLSVAKLNQSLRDRTWEEGEERMSQERERVQDEKGREGKGEEWWRGIIFFSPGLQALRYLVGGHL